MIYETERDTPNYKLFHSYWLVSTQQMYLYSQTGIECHGVRQGFQSDSMTLAQLTIAEMAEIIHNGGSLIFHDIKDIPDTCQLVLDYFELLHLRLSNSLNIVNAPPQEDLDKFREYINTVYHDAMVRQHLKPRSELDAFLSEESTFTASPIVTEGVDATVVHDVPQETTDRIYEASDIIQKLSPRRKRK